MGAIDVRTRWSRARERAWWFEAVRLWVFVVCGGFVGSVVVVSVGNVDIVRRSVSAVVRRVENGVIREGRFEWKVSMSGVSRESALSCVDSCVSESIAMLGVSRYSDMMARLSWY